MLVDARFTQPVTLAKKDFPMKFTPHGGNMSFWSKYPPKMPCIHLRVKVE